MNTEDMRQHFEPDGSPVIHASGTAALVVSDGGFGPACRAVGTLAGKYEALRSVLMENEPWPLRDVLAKLIEASEILMHEKNYDGHGWEQISHAIERGKAALSSWPNSRNEPRHE